MTWSSPSCWSVTRCTIWRARRRRCTTRQGLPRSPAYAVDRLRFDSNLSTQFPISCVANGCEAREEDATSVLGYTCTLVRK